MSAIEFLTVVDNQGTAKQVEALLSHFQQKSRVSIHGQFVGWDRIWHELVNMGIYRQGADLAEVGTTWLESLVAMNALRPFTSDEINRLGGKSAFIPATWTSTSISGDDRVWGIPIRCDVRVIWYWKDMLEQVKVNPSTAFKNPKNTEKTLEKLKSIIPTPWGLVTAYGDPNIIQTLGTWLWAFESDFVSQDGERVPLLEPASLKAMRAYFGLSRFMPKDNPELLGANLFELFANRKLAAFVGGPWTRYTINQQNFSKKKLGSIGVAVMPGPPFVGGTVLSIWQHSRKVEDVLKFVEYLIRPEVQLEFCPYLGLLPTRRETWKLPAMANDPYHKVIYQALSKGRSFPAVPLWGMIEEKLKNCFSLIWKDLMTNPDANVDQTISTYLEPTVVRLNVGLK